MSIGTDVTKMTKGTNKGKKTDLQKQGMTFTSQGALKESPRMSYRYQGQLGKHVRGQEGIFIYFTSSTADVHVQKVKKH